MEESNPFPKGKHEIVRDQLVYHGHLTLNDIAEPALISDEIITLTHDAEYWHQVKTVTLPPAAVRKIGLPLNPKTVMRAIASASSTFEAAIGALDSRLGINLGGGTHHAYKAHAEGYCILNDIAISARYLLKHKKIAKALVVDLDVHQGNGTASIFAQNPDVFTFSMHCKDNYPAHKEKSDVDVELPAGTTDDVFMHHLHKVLPKIIEDLKPDIVYYIAGADVLSTDRIGKFSMTIRGMAAREHFVYEQASMHKIPLVLTLGGEYPRALPGALAYVADAHAQTIALALQHFS